MTKSPAKAAPAQPDTAPKGRSWLKLAGLVVAPLLLAAAGYASGAYHAGMMAAAGGAHEAPGEGAAKAPMVVSAMPSEIAAETSLTHSYALSVLISARCGALVADALKAASDKEAEADGRLVSLSWQAAARRTAILDERNCEYMLAEVAGAEHKARRIAEAARAKDETASAH